RLQHVPLRAGPRPRAAQREHHPHRLERDPEPDLDPAVRREGRRLGEPRRTDRQPRRARLLLPTCAGEPGAMIERVRKLTRLGPHPVLIGRYVAHHLGRRVHERRLRSGYDALVNRPGAPALRLVPIELPPADSLPEAAERIRSEADSILRHEVDYLGSGLVALGDEIDWQRDFKSGYVWPRSFYLDVEVTRLGDDSDAKVPWELSRGHQLLTLARAFALFRDERDA